MSKLISLGLVFVSTIFGGCYDPFYQIPKSCAEDRLVSFMNERHGGINKNLAGSLPSRDFDYDAKNDFYVVGKDGVIVAQLTSKRDKVWYDLGTNRVWKR